MGKKKKKSRPRPLDIVTVTRPGPDLMPENYRFWGQFRSGDNDNDPEGSTEYCIGTETDGQFYWGNSATDPDQLESGNTVKRKIYLTLAGSNGTGLIPATTPSSSTLQIDDGEDYRTYVEPVTEDPYYTVAAVGFQAYASEPIEPNDEFNCEISITSITVGTQTMTGVWTVAAGYEAQTIKDNILFTVAVAGRNPNVSLSGTIRLWSYRHPSQATPRNAIIGRFYVFDLMPIIMNNAELNAAPPPTRPPLTPKAPKLLKLRRAVGE